MALHVLLHRLESLISSKIARYLLLGFLHPLYSLAYEITGSLHGWYRLGGRHCFHHRFLGVPIMFIMFRFFVGIAFSFSRSASRKFIENYKAGLSLGSRIHQIPVLVQIIVEVVVSVFITTVLMPVLVIPPLALWWGGYQ